MITRNMQILYKLFIMIALVIFAGCGANNSPQSASEGAITANLAWNTTGKSAGKVVASAPAGVTTVRIIVSATGMTTIQKDFTAASGSGTISGVPAGAGRTLTAQGLNSSGRVIYQGTAANLAVQPGQTTNAGTITMAATFTISGKITSIGSALSGVITATLSGNGSTVVNPVTSDEYSDTIGNFSFSGVNNGGYTITPLSNNGYIFSPTSQTIVLNGSNISGINFTATATNATTYSISGTIFSGGVVLSGVTVTMSDNGSTTTTNNSGNYSINGVQNGNHTITPSKTGYTFNHASLSVTINKADNKTVNFNAYKVPNDATTGAIQIPKTGQDVLFAPGDDGAWQRGVAWPDPRFTDNANGTVTDNLTGLIWLKYADCDFSYSTWAEVLAGVNNLRSGNCELTDGSTAGQWRLPNINELESLVSSYSSHSSISAPFYFNDSSPIHRYWSSTSDAYSPNRAWYIDMGSGDVSSDSKINDTYFYDNNTYLHYYGLAVRSGQ